MNKYWLITAEHNGIKLMFTSPILFEINENIYLTITNKNNKYPNEAKMWTVLGISKELTTCEINEYVIDYAEKVYKFYTILYDRQYILNAVLRKGESLDVSKV